MIRPTLEEARELAAGCSLVPIALELFADLKTPVEVLRTLKDRGEECYLLESAPSGETWGRYTFLGFDPEATLSGAGDTLTLAGKQGTEVRQGHLPTLLKELIGTYQSPRIEFLPPFTGGFVGYFAYEYITQVETALKLNAVDDVGFHDFRLMLFNKVIAFDHYGQKIFLIVNVATENLESNYIDGVTILKDMEQLVLAVPPEAAHAPQGELTPADFTASFSKAAFVAAVEKAKQHIFEGDIFQCVPSIRFRAPYGDDLLEAYRVLRTTNPSAYMFYLRFKDLQLAGASPETLISLQDGQAATYPLAGTCPRTADEAETEALIAELLTDAKELAEHDMLVDLGRNDLGKICRFGSVRVTEYRRIKKLSHVCHIASKITGEPQEGLSALEVMAAVLPAGTLSGAPKKRACEIIDELEGLRRGPYGGAVGYIDFTGNMDLCIGIRMAVLKDHNVYVQSGAGIVADSEPEKEYAEVLRKAHAMMAALRREGR
jgi:anthranilate synthase component 1